MSAPSRRSETVLHHCPECGYAGEKRGHANRDGQVCWAWSQMQPLDFAGFRIVGHPVTGLPLVELKK